MSRDILLEHPFRLACFGAPSHRPSAWGSGLVIILVNTLMENVYTMVCEWSPDMAAYAPDALHYIDEAEEMLKKFGVPLPANEAVQFLISQKDSSLGKSFDGLRLSYLSKNVGNRERMQI